jgi:hypothetical protein
MIFPCFQVSGKATDDTVRAVVLTKWVAIPEDAFTEAEKKLLQYMEAFMKMEEVQNTKAKDNASSVCKALLEEFCGILTVCLWPEELMISRARQKSFKRVFHMRLFDAVDSK